MSGAAKSSKSRAKKPPVKQEHAVRPAAPAATRRLKPSHYRSLKFHKHIKHPIRLPGAWKLAKQARQLIFKHWKVIGGIVLVYGLLNMLLVRGLSGGLDVRQLKDEFDTFFRGAIGHLASGGAVLALLIGSSTTTSGAKDSSAYQMFLLLMVSLALVWAYRQLLAGNKIRIRDAFYSSMYPVIPVILVLLVVSLQCIPLVVGGWLFSTVVQNGIAVTGLERTLWGMLFFLFALLTCYMLTSSIFALYIATLQNMTPLKALRSARQLVRHRRWVVMRKVLFLPLWLLLIGALVMLPVILLLPIAAQWVFFVLIPLGIAASQAYMYILYRELLREKN